MIRLIAVAILALAPTQIWAQTILADDLEVSSLASVQAALAAPFEPATDEDGAQEKAVGSINLTRLVYGGTAAQRVETCRNFMTAWKQGFRAIEDNQTAFYGDWLTVKCHALHWLQTARAPKDKAPPIDKALMGALPGWFTTDRSCAGGWKAMQASMRGDGWADLDAVEFTPETPRRISFETDRQTGAIELLAFADLDGDQKGELLLLFEIEDRLGAIRESHIVRLTRKSGAWALFDPAYRLRSLVQTCPDQLGQAFAGACPTE